MGRTMDVFGTSTHQHTLPRTTRYVRQHWICVLRVGAGDDAPGHDPDVMSFQYSPTAPTKSTTSVPSKMREVYVEKCDGTIGQVEHGDKLTTALGNRQRIS